MPNYQNSKIYKLVCENPNLIYIGSTTQKYLSSRLQTHRRTFQLNKKETSSFELFKHGKVEIILLEKFPCDCKEELLKRERFYLENFDCVNQIKRPIITPEERKENLKRNFNTEKNKQYQKDYQLLNREKKKEYDKIRYNENKKKICERAKERYNQKKMSN